jgi:hypothetical protein
LSDGTVDLEDVIKVLRDNGVSVEKDKSGAHPRGMYIISRQGQMIEAKELPKKCRRRLVRDFSRKYQIDMKEFYFREREVQ